jgi:hypothetical protein
VRVGRWVALGVWFRRNLYVIQCQARIKAGGRLKAIAKHTMNQVEV